MSWSEYGDPTDFSHERADLSHYGNISLAEMERRELLQISKLRVTSLCMAEKLWQKGFSGAKVKMAVFDTGIREDHPHFHNIMERTNWTDEDTLSDGLGHGTFVAGVIAGHYSDCPGFAPDAEIFAFRVFTNQQVSYTSWFLDAFNYAILSRMNILNLSIGGPDYLDRPFIEKVWEMSANNIIMVSAIGNDGPLYGTLNNPADQSDVIGVGGMDYENNMASFSSRGMTTWELPHGYGRMKPDIVAYGREVTGSRMTDGCRSLSGTSVASPVVAGAVCLLASVVPEKDRWRILNPASMKQALLEGADRLDGAHMFEQGMGKLNLLASYRILANYTPRASVVPAVLDLTQCPYAWPFCKQPLYSGAMPITFNATVINGMGVVGWIRGQPSWVPSKGPGAGMLDVSFTFSSVLWPWSGYLGLSLTVNENGKGYSGTIEGVVSLTVVSPPGTGEVGDRVSECRMSLKVAVIPTPRREKRVLWDQFHNIRYPPGYVPRDSLEVRNDLLDWHGDHPHTNYHGMFNELRDRGYFLEILGSPFTCFDARNYGTLLVVDTEDEFFDEEIAKLRDDVTVHGLGLVVFGEWYHVETMKKMRFFDDNTRSWWTPITGGANVPALNDLLRPFGIGFGDVILNGQFSIGGDRAYFSSGTEIRSFPANGFVHRFMFHESSGQPNSAASSGQFKHSAQTEATILGLTSVGNGRIAVYGDSNCLDSSHMLSPCYWLLDKMLQFTGKGRRDPLLFHSSKRLKAAMIAGNDSIPVRRNDVDFAMYSAVVGKSLMCGADSPQQLQGTHGFVPKNLSRMKGRTVESLDQSKEDAATNATAVEDEYEDKPLDEDIAKNMIFDGMKDMNDTYDDLPADIGKSDGEDANLLDENAGGRFQRLHFGWNQRIRTEIDPSIIAYQWLIVGFLGASGFLLFWGLWTGRRKGLMAKPPPRSPPLLNLDRPRGAPTTVPSPALIG